MGNVIMLSDKAGGNLKSYWPVVLALLAILLQPFGRTVELPVLIMAMVGMFDLVKNTDSIRAKIPFKVFSALFLCIWLPSLVSLVGAQNIEKSVSTSLGLLRFYLAGVFILARLAKPEYIKVLIAGTAFVALFWSADNLFQAVVGIDFFGRPPIAGRIPGIFGDAPRSGWMLIPLAFVAALYFWKHVSRPVALLVISVLLMAIVVSGDRGAIVAAVWALAALVVFSILAGKRVTLKVLILGIAGIGLVVLSLSQVPQVVTRYENTVSALDGGYEAWDVATSRRLTLWSTAVKIVEDNPLNGVGVRGFRYAYPEYAPDGDMFVHGDTGAYHAHHIVIEVLADTGSIGLIGYILMLGIFVWLIREAIRRKAYLALGYLASVVGVLMPINSHLSMYSSYWAQACWFLFAVTVAAVFYENKDKAEV